MSQTVGGNQVSTFTTPVNATSPIDANTVRGNDNTMKSAFNAHDADGGLHLQSSAASAQPTAGTLGRKWLTTDTGAVLLYFDTGSAWVEVNYLRNTGGTISGAVVISDTTDATNTTSGSLKTAGGVGIAKALWVGGLANIAGAVTLQSTLTINGQTYTFPASQTSGYFLKTDGSGSLSWAKPTELVALADLSDVTITSVQTGDVLRKSSGDWVNEAPTSTNTASRIVLRDGSGNFSAGTITATLSGNVTGNVTGNVSGSSGSCTGNAATATALATARAINGTNFDGTGAITVPVNNADDTSTNATMYPLWTATAGGNYAAKVSTTKLSFNPSTGTLTASGFSGPLTGNVTGNVSGSSGSTTGNAATATKLATARNINGVSFDGSADITVTAAAGTLSGTTLASGVTASSLTSVGTLTGLTSSGAVSITNTTQSTSTTTGALVVSGGLGVAKDAFLGGALSVTGTSTLTGNVGVGGAASAWASPFIVLQNQNVSFAVSSNGPGIGYFFGNAYYDGAYKYIASGYAASYRINDNGQFLWLTAPSGTAGNTATFSTAMTLDASGNLGLGVTPSAWGSAWKALQVGTVAVSTNSNTGAYLSSNFVSGTGGDKYIVSGAASVYAQADGVHKWYYAASGTAGNAITFTQAMTLDASGNLTVPGIYSATVGGTNRDVYVDSTGLLGYVSSIRRAKTNITPLADTSWLMALAPVSFNYRKKDADGAYTDEPDGVTEYGLIAEDTEAVNPDLCFYDIVDGKQELRGISYSKLIVPMLKRIQELEARLNA